MISSSSPIDDSPLMVFPALLALLRERDQRECGLLRVCPLTPWPKCRGRCWCPLSPKCPLQRHQDRKTAREQAEARSGAARKILILDGIGWRYVILADALVQGLGDALDTGVNSGHVFPLSRHNKSTVGVMISCFHLPIAMALKLWMYQFGIES